MSDIFGAICKVISAGDWLISAHAVRELAADGILLEPLIDRTANAIVVEDYPTYHKGPCVLILQHDEFGAPLHLLWGLGRAGDGPAVLVTAYRPDPARWSTDFTERRKDR